MTSKGTVFLFLPVFLQILLLPVRSISLDENALTGIFTPTYVPFNRTFESKVESFVEEYKLNVDKVDPYVKFLSENGVDGVIISEGSPLPLEERKRLLDAFIVAREKYGIQVIVQVGGMTVFEILDLTRYAAKVQVDAIATIPDTYFRPRDIKELIVYLKTIAAAAPDTPFFYLDYPLITNVMLDMTELFTQAECQIPNFVGIVTSLESGLEVMGNIRLKPYQRIFGNNELSIASIYSYGLNASSPVISNVFPAEVKQIANSIKSGDISAGIEIQIYLNKIITASGYTTGYEHLKDYYATVKAEIEIVNGISLGTGFAPIPLIVGSEKRRVLIEQLRELGVDIASEE